MTESALREAAKAVLQAIDDGQPFLDSLGKLREALAEKPAPGLREAAKALSDFSDWDPVGRTYIVSRDGMRALRAALAEPLPVAEPNVKTMVDRFLGWKLPRTFNPDHHISFDRAKCGPDKMGNDNWPIGTNLFTADEAREMFEHVLYEGPRADGMPASKTERELRRMLALRVGGPGVYMDDGEASDCTEHPFIDFMRDSVEQIQDKLQKRGFARYEKLIVKSPPNPQWPNENASAPPPSAPAAQPVGQEPALSHIVTLSGHQVRQLMDFCCPNGSAASADELESEVDLQRCAARKSRTGEDLPEGVYVWMSEYPEEGCLLLEPGGQSQTLGKIASEFELRRLLAEERETTRQLSAALRKEIETPVFMGEPIGNSALAAAPQQPVAPEPKKLAVWYGPMPESNGKSNFTAILHAGDIAEGHTIDRSEYPDRVRYEADRVRYLIGELNELPWILDYDADKHSGYRADPQPVVEQAQADGWIQHDGSGFCPVGDMVVVHARFIDCQEICAVGELINWKRVLAYKLAAAPQAGQQEQT